MPDVYKAENFHLDKRATQLAAAGGDDDELLTPEQLASWFGVSLQWLSHQRRAGGGPPYDRISRYLIRYRRAKVRAWLDARSYRSTREYRGEREAGRRHERDDRD